MLAPTRELAQQIEKVMRALGEYLGVSGGAAVALVDAAAAVMVTECRGGCCSCCYCCWRECADLFVAVWVGLLVFCPYFSALLVQSTRQGGTLYG